ncbi:MAG: hypothetical protein HYZ40_07750 [Rhodospirillales bacterium]|nr:hypothetical protein [Rhodospirillales bacterium]
MLNDAMQPIDIADSLDRFQWEALRALCAPTPDPSRVSGAAVEQLLRSDLLELRGDRPSITAKGRQVMVCGSPSLWNS